MTMKKLAHVVALGALVSLAPIGAAQAQNNHFQTDHFKCYQTIPVPDPGHIVGETVTLIDQFDDRQVKVKKALRLCTPVTKAHGQFGDTEIQHPEDHLVCYRTAEPQFPFQQRTVFVRNQFGDQILTVTGRERVLCVPSFKCVVDPATNECTATCSSDQC
jgi:hypothetical protein